MVKIVDEKVSVQIENKGYDIKIGLKKFGRDFLIVLLSGAVVVWQNDAKYMMIIPAIKFALNYIKNK